MNTQIATCLLCEKSCSLQADIQGEQLLGLRGQGCQKGFDFILSRIRPQGKIVSTSVLVSNHSLKFLPVRTGKAVDNALASQILREARKITVTPPVRYGQVIMRNVAGTGVELISTKALDPE
jgi:CxxC motif-containing protein